jgi:leader peptidase (prepilin peptidase)/N-methyltransferase
LLIGFGILWIINTSYRLIKGVDGIGGGDFILLSSIGSMVGIFALPFVVLLGSLSALLIYLLKEKNSSKEIPLGSGFILGFLLYCFMNYFELLQSYMVY